MADDSHESHGLRATEIIRVVPAIILLLGLLAFGLANTDETQVDLLYTETSAPLVLVLAATAVAGALIAALLRFRRRHHHA